MLTGLQRLLFATTSLEAQLYPPLKLPVRFRPYATNDFGQCLDIYEKNAPGRFPDWHISKFKDYLNKEPKTSIIAEYNGKVVGHGGIAQTSPESAILCYGIIDPEFQKQRIGTALVLLRIAQIPPMAGKIYIIINAVDASMPIYTRFGFVECGKWKSSEEKLNPIGLLAIHPKSHQRIRAVLNRRGIYVEGNLILHPSESILCRIETSPGGKARILFEKRADSQKTSSASPPS